MSKHKIFEDGTYNNMEEPNKTEEKRERNEKGQFVDGNPGSPGRPKGKTLKEFAREFLLSMSDDDKRDFLNSLSKDIVWRMAEGNPHQSSDIDIEIKPQPIADVLQNQSIQEDNPTSEENTGSTGGDISE